MLGLQGRNCIKFLRDLRKTKGKGLSLISTKLSHSQFFSCTQLYFHRVNITKEFYKLDG